MKAVLCHAHGPASTLAFEEIADPVAGPGEVVVAMRACALNFFDTLIIRDRYQFKPALPFSPGGEIAGVVESVGAGVTNARPGDRVVVYVKWGGAREKVVVPASALVPMPDDLDFVPAATLSVTYGTAVHGLADRGEVKPGETVAVLGASGGVGQAAIEVAKILGARVIACASGAEKLAFCRDVGADETVDYDAEDLKQRLKDLTDGRGVDVVFDAVGDRYAEPAVRATGWRGRYLVIGFAAGDIPRIPLNLLLLKGCDLRGVFWGDYLVREPARFAEDMKRIMAWVVEGRLKPHIQATVPLVETARAIEAIAERRVKGKIVVTA